MFEQIDRIISAFWIVRQEDSGLQIRTPCAIELHDEHLHAGTPLPNIQGGRVLWPLHWRIQKIVLRGEGVLRAMPPAGVQGAEPPLKLEY